MATGSVSSMTIDDQSLAGLFVMDLLAATMTRGSSTQSFRMMSWVESAIQHKIIEDLPSVYPKGPPDSPNLVFPETAHLWLPHHKTVVIWRSSSIQDIKVYQSYGTPVDSDLALLPDMRKVSDTADTFFVVHVPYNSNNVQNVWVSPVCTEASEDEMAARTALVRDLTYLTITKQSARDKQKSLGPSDLADPCDVCVARKIATVCGFPTTPVPRTFSHKAWIGTAIHQKLERDLPLVYPRGSKEDPNFYQEVRATIGEVSGLGTVRGHLDLLLPKRGLVVDYKTADLARINKYKEKGVPAAHAGQTMLYLRGVRNAGRVARMAALVYIPRDSNDLSDIWIATCSYQDPMATGLLNRAQNLVEVVRSNQADKLVSAEDCWPCNVQPLIKS